MAVNVTPGLEIPEPSDYSSCEDDDDALTYFTDLHQSDKNRPEPARMIDKLLNNLVDSAWEVISEQEKIDKDAQAAGQIPVLNATKEMKVLFYMYSTIIQPHHFPLHMCFECICPKCSSYTPFFFFCS